MRLSRNAAAGSLLVAFASSALGSGSPGSLRVRALGCFFELPSGYTLIADPGNRIVLIGERVESVEIEPYSDRLLAGSRTVSTERQGHLTILELTDDAPREALRTTIVHNGVQGVVLQRGARGLVKELVRSCLANVHPGAPGAPK